MRAHVLAACGWALAVATVELSGQPVGAEFRANTYTSGSQDLPAITAFPAASSPFVVVWSGQGTGDNIGIFFRRFSPGLAPVGGDLRANSAAGYNERDAHAAALGADLSAGFVVVWNALVPGGQQDDVRGRIFGGASSTPLGVEFRVNSVTTGYQNTPAVAAAPNGDFLVVWSDELSDAGPFQIYGRGFSISGAPLGAEFRVNTYTSSTGGQDVASDGAGGFLVVWSEFDGGGRGIYVRRVSATGVSVGSPLRLNAVTTNEQAGPVIAGSAGTFLVVWADISPGPENVELVGRRLDSTGSPLGGELRINTYTSNAQEATAVSGDSAGNFLVVWRSQQDGDSQSVHGQLLVNGSPRGGEFRVNTVTTGSQGYPAVAAIAPGSFLVAWRSVDGSSSGISARFVCLHGDANMDGVVTVADVLYLINNLFAGGPDPAGCADVDGSDSLNVNDVLYLINFLFAGGTAPL